MQMDATTIADLEILQSVDGAGGLLALVDRTATSMGHMALRRRLTSPSSDLATIRDTQDAVRFLQAHPSLLLLDEQSVQRVRRYLSSNITITTASRVGRKAEQAWMTVRYRDLLKELTAGVDATETLFAQIRRVCTSVEKACTSIEGRSPPALITSYGAELSTIAEEVHGACDRTDILDVDRTLRRSLQAEIERAIGLLGELDALNAMAAATTEHRWVMPELVDSDSFLLDAEGIYHPFVTHPISNPIRLTGGEPMVFLTGPNMAGKTTYLRSVAITVLLAQVGLGVPARRARLTPVEALLTSLNPTDNLKAGLSYFLAEVLRVKSAATLLAEGCRALVLFDEVFKGTNVRDALEASTQVILGFSKARRSGFIFSSHLVELVEALRPNPAIRFCYFDAAIVAGAPRYSFELRDGVSEQRFGLLLLEHAEIPELLARISA